MVGSVGGMLMRTNKPVLALHVYSSSSSGLGAQRYRSNCVEPQRTCGLVTLRRFRRGAVSHLAHGQIRAAR